MATKRAIKLPTTKRSGKLPIEILEVAPAMAIAMAIIMRPRRATVIGKHGRHKIYSW